MLLVIDIGNSNIVMGTYEFKELRNHWRISTDRTKTGDEYGMIINQLFDYNGIGISNISDIIISSVVPTLTIPIIKMCKRYFNISPMVVGSGLKTGINIHYDNPKNVGADRIVNAIGAYEVYGGNLIVVDIGTATTFDVVGENGDFMGGVIAPGIIASADALTSSTAKLPRVELVPPKTIISHNTINGMQSGIIYGYVGLIDGIANRIKNEIGNSMKVIATGGLATMIANVSTTIDNIDHFLTLTGLRVLYERNRQ